MNKYIFNLIWRNKLENIQTEIGYSIACNDEQTARERAFETAMKIHKNMCMKDKNFSSEWYYSRIELKYIVPNYSQQ